MLIWQCQYLRKVHLSISIFVQHAYQFIKLGIAERCIHSLKKIKHFKIIQTITFEYWIVIVWVIAVWQSTANVKMDERRDDIYINRGKLNLSFTYHILTNFVGLSVLNVCIISWNLYYNYQHNNLWKYCRLMLQMWEWKGDYHPQPTQVKYANL